jgi:membrane fusion protein, multidrug efflux system
MRERHVLRATDRGGHGSGRRCALSSMLALAAAALLCAPGCAKKKAPPQAPVEVLFVPASLMDAPVVGEWIGTLEGSVNADIRPKIEGYLLRQLYKEGQFVRRGDHMFEIDPRQFRAALDQAQGSLARTEAQLSKAAKDVERFTPLAAQRAISQEELDNALAAERDARGGVAAARAAVEQASLNLGWTSVTSPIDGIAGIARTQVGDLVSTQSVMATVSTVDPIKVTYGISEREYLPRAALINRDSYPTTKRGPVLELILEDGSTFPYPGQAVYADRDVNVKTGTMTIKGIFPNPHNILRPGQYARVRAQLDVKKGAVVVPQSAVTELQGGARIAVVTGDGKADLRSVQMGQRVGDVWVVEKGLRAGERVVVSGIQYLRQDTPVSAKPAPSPSPNAPAGK